VGWLGLCQLVLLLELTYKQQQQQQYTAMLLGE
jgi:hypothetical protein